MLSYPFNLDLNGHPLPLTQEDLAIYNCSLFILLLSGATLGLWWICSNIKNPN